MSRSVPLTPTKVRVVHQKTNEKRSRIQPRPFLLWSIGMFVLCLLALLASLRSEPMLGDNRRLAFLVSIPISAAASVAGASVVCALLQVVREVRSGNLLPSDLVAPGIMAAMVGLLILGYSSFPNLTGVIELSLWGVCLVVWIADVTRRVIRKKSNCGTTTSSTLR